MSNWYRKYTKRHLSKRLSFHRDKHYTYKNNYNILKVVVIFLVVLLIYFNWSFISTNLILAKEGFVKFYGDFLEGSFDEGISKIQDKGTGVVEKVKDTVTRDEVDYSIIENEIFKLINEERARNGARSLISNSNLNELSREHSEEMITQNFFEHSNLNVGENIGEVPIHYDVI